MEGVYKTKISHQQLQEVVLYHFGQSLREFIELADGWANSAYLLTLEDDRVVVLKASPRADVKRMRCELNTMQTEVEVMRLLADVEDFPIPRIYAYDDSLQLLPVTYFIMECLEGQPYSKLKESLSKDDQDYIERQLGYYNRQINEVTGTYFGAVVDDGSTRSSSWRECFRKMIFGVLQDGEEAGVVLPLSYEALRTEIDARLGVLDEVVVPQLVHWDLWEGNVFVKDGVITGIIDYERAMWGDPLIEVYFGRFYPSEGFRLGYDIPPFGESQLARRKLYDLFLDLIIVIECAFRQYDNPEHSQWTSDNLDYGLEQFLRS
ncbi:MAG: aminoglycoside phosphotransferase family protein [Candidatus Cohnella colombiensis]|uniref:Aminoglycoside phosphotransferase family protein n=1 Tax=Candidatus Cohnella colombiensis TaxID=3121368 RepID=A0AA95JB62_9BACL|nr:MAG: aminoglycoside phosphotransferase family protein [Cohnella sp.]